METYESVVLASVIAGLLNAQAHAASVTLSGPDENDGSYTSAQLQVLATATGTVSYGGLTGISLLGAARRIGHNH